MALTQTRVQSPPFKCITYWSWFPNKYQYLSYPVLTCTPLTMHILAHSRERNLKMAIPIPQSSSQGLVSLQWLFVWSQTSSITWEPVRHAHCQAHSRPTELGTLEVGISSPGDRYPQVWEALLHCSNYLAPVFIPSEPAGGTKGRLEELQEQEAEVVLQNLLVWQFLLSVPEQLPPPPPVSLKVT